jgi:superfamily II DNA helicase RecQ
VYFVATALLRAQGSGPTVIVSPLLALMRNQIAAAERAHTLYDEPTAWAHWNTLPA